MVMCVTGWVLAAVWCVAFLYQRRQTYLVMNLLLNLKSVQRDKRGEQRWT